MESPPTTLIEGLGDEVTVVVGIVILLLALILAWLSTYVAEVNDPLLNSLLPTRLREPIAGLRNTVRPNPEPPRPVESQVEKPEEGAQGQGGEQDADTENATLDQMLDIQGVPMRAQAEAPVRVEEEEEDSSDYDYDGLLDSSLEEESKESRKLRKQQLYNRNWRVVPDPPQVETQPDDGLIKVRLKFLNETEELASVSPDDTIGTLKSKYFPGQEPQMKLIYQGQLLHDSTQTLRSLHITDNCVIHCHRSQATVPSSTVGPESGETRQEYQSFINSPLGNLVIPLFVVLLVLIWYFRINYRQFFTTPATFSLVGVTVFFSFMVCGLFVR